jgi:RinA family phage transcriptional activator
MLCQEEVDENTGGGRDSLLRKPAEPSAARLAKHKRLVQLEKIANDIERIYTQLQVTHQRMIPLWYWTRPRRYTWDGLADKYK